VCWLNAKPLADLVKGNSFTVNTQRGAEAKVTFLIGFDAVKSASQGAKNFSRRLKMSVVAHETSLVDICCHAQAIRLNLTTSARYLRNSLGIV